jgi:hypothetical protein
MIVAYERTAAAPELSSRSVMSVRRILFLLYFIVLIERESGEALFVTSSATLFDFEILGSVAEITM